MIYGDQAAITSAHNQALRRLAAALRCALGDPERSQDAATGHGHVNAAINAIEQAEAAAVHTNDPIQVESVRIDNEPGTIHIPGISVRTG